MVRQTRIVDAMAMEDLVDEVYALALVFHDSDILWGESRAVGEVCARFDLLIAEILRRVEDDDWAPPSGERQ